MVSTLHRILLTALFLLAASAAWAAPVNVYRGTLGKAEVVMELGQPQPDGTRTGRYFYRRHGVDIPLQGTLNQMAEALPLRAELLGSLDDVVDSGPLFEDAEQRQIIWRARMQGNALVGEWRDGIHGKKLPFRLQRIARYDPEKIAPHGVPFGVSISMQITPYDYLRVAQHPLEQGKEIVLASNLAWRLVRDARTQFWYPRLTRHPSARILAQTNAILEQRHWAMSLMALDCVASIYKDRGPDAGTLAGFDGESIQVSYLSHALMSVVESGSIGCGGAHPHNHYDPFTLDLLRGGYLDFSRILRGVSYTEKGWREYSPELFDFFEQSRSRFTRKHDETDCGVYPGYMVPMFETSTSGSGSRQNKLSFVVSGVGHASGACLGSGVSVPFSELKPMLQPKAAPYLRP